MLWSLSLSTDESNAGSRSEPSSGKHRRKDEEQRGDRGGPASDPPVQATESFVAEENALTGEPPTSEASDDSEGRPNLETRLTGSQRRKHLHHCLFAGIVSWLSTIAMAGIATTLFIILSRLAGAALGVRQAPVVEPMLVLWIVSTVALGIFWTGYCYRTLGVRAPDRVPVRWKNILDVASMKDELKLLRVAVIVLVALPFVSSMLHSLAPRINRDWTTIGYSPVFLFGWVAMMLSGLTIWVCSVPAFRELRAKYLLNSLRFHHRGVALRSFISEWDNPARPIYRSCRLSRHVSRAHTTIFISTAACFSFAGCLAGLLDATRYLGDLMSFGSMVAIASMWPTPKRLVNWSAETLDKFCDDREEYEFY